jgi:uncharacterized small protein (DUF1192 family)
MEEDDRPRRTVPFTPPPLDSWGVEDLRAYIATLRAEIGRTEAAIASRDRHRSAADAFFRPPRAE